MTIGYQPVVLGCFAPNWSALDSIQRLRNVEMEGKTLTEFFRPYRSQVEFIDRQIHDYAPVRHVIGDFGTRIVAFHFGGHADADTFSLSESSGERISVHGFAPLLASLPNLRLVFLNGCGTIGWIDQLFAQENSKIVAVIATHATIQDSVAQKFAKIFYEQFIEHGKSLQESMEQTDWHVRSEHPSGLSCERKGSWIAPEPFNRQQPDLPWTLETRSPEHRSLTWQELVQQMHTHELPDWIERYQQQVSRNWATSWHLIDETAGDVDQQSSSAGRQAGRSNKSRGFLTSQGFQWLRPKDPDNDLIYCVRELTRQRHRSAAASLGNRDGQNAAKESNRWLEIEREQLATGRLVDEDGQVHELRRVVLTTDAGIGKSANLEWLQYAINQRAKSEHATIEAAAETRSSATANFATASSATVTLIDHSTTSLAILLRLGSLKPPGENELGEEWLERQLVREWQKNTANGTKKLDDIPALAMVKRLRDEGRLVLLIDELDQARQNVIEALGARLNEPSWSRCRVIVAGRPYAIRQNRKGLFSLGQHRDLTWHFVQINEFTEDQQRSYLGTMDDGGSRYKTIPPEVREILRTPRVLYYIRHEIPDNQLETIKNASDVYAMATRNLIQEGLEGSKGASENGLGLMKADVTDTTISLAYRILSGFAFLMLQTVPPPDETLGNTTDRDESGPNFSKVSGMQLADLRNRLFKRLVPDSYAKDDRSKFDEDLKRIQAMNTVVQWGIIDSALNEELLWRNRQLQEFLIARWLSSYASPDDSRSLELYLPHDPATDAYYWIWRFTTEMPDQHQLPEKWLQSIEPLYQPGDGTRDGTRRSTEMIYRSWHRVERYGKSRVDPVDKLARSIHDKFLSEFGGILQDPDVQRRQSAEAIRRNLKELPGGTFEMGSPPGQQAMPDEDRKSYEELLKEGQECTQGADSESIEQFVERRILPRFNFPPGRAGDGQRKAHREFWPDVIREQSMDKIRAAFYPADEDPSNVKQIVPPFQLSRFPVLNSWYRLFDPGHGLVQSDYQSEYRRISPTDRHPAIMVSWFDAWVFCQWLHWDGESCRLPYENEWEYACRAGTPRKWPYWWEGDFGGDNARRRTADQVWKSGSTTVPEDFEKEHANPWGFVDILGNVWEWCEDEYQERYERRTTKHPSVLRRVGRGGGWGADAWSCRAAVRVADVPGRRDDSLGFRLARSSVKQASDEVSQ
jgi:formylglycine-generating enzyme required for sulfatase activity